MTQTLLAWLALPLLIAAAYPWARWLIARGPEPDGRLLAYTLTPGLAVGMLTLIMFWLGVVGLRYSAASVALPYLAICALGIRLWMRSRRALARSPTASARDLIWLLPVALVAAAVLFNAAYWPFSRDDVLGIYQPFAQMMAESRTLVPLTGGDSLYRAYPMAMPLAYAYSYIISGWENEYLARMIPALLSLGCLPAAYLIGRRLIPAQTGAGHLAGVLSASILAFTPTFVRWASSGYVDLPMAYYWALTVLFCLRTIEGGAHVDALLAGVCLGLAAWTKNAALAGVPLLIGALAWAWWRQRIRLSDAALSLIAVAAVAGPWYLRNLIGAGFLMPDTAWTDQARRTLVNLAPFIAQPQDYGLMGWVITAGLLLALWRVTRALLGFRRTALLDTSTEYSVLSSEYRVLSSEYQVPSTEHRAPSTEHRAPSTEHQSLSTQYSALLLWWIVPYFLIWWLFASYDPRFLLHLLPLLAALGGALLAEIGLRLPGTWRGWLRIVVAAAALILALQAMWTAVEFKDELLRDPLMGHEAKVAIVRGQSAD
ncbi:MAG: glycosyltransferase family 39 protein [Anaerolineae bacterium]|nr:glycosyltransferase family 39 protein [Anaerolineae bacterium]